MKRLFRWILSILKFTLSQVVARCVSRDAKRKGESGTKLNITKRVHYRKVEKETLYDKQSDPESGERRE